MSKLILVVDDFNSTRQVIRSILEKEGHQVLLAENGEAALEHLNKRNVELVLTDLNMPGMNGIELVKAIRKSEKYYRVPVLMLTTEMNNEKIRTAQNAGITGLIKKPFQTGDFIRMINRILK